MTKHEIKVSIGRDGHTFNWLALQLNETNKTILDEFLNKYPKNLLYNITKDKTALDLIKEIQKDWPGIINITKEQETHINFSVQKDYRDANINDILAKLNQEALITFYTD